ncbi:MAG: hypothetical protein R2770_06215 [Acidimicrobiales bacterium]
MKQLGKSKRFTAFGLLVSAALVGGACTGGSSNEASPPTSSPGETGSSAPTSTAPDDSAPASLPRADDVEAGTSSVELLFPDVLLLSDGGSIRQIRGDDETTLARVEPLQPGADPADSETFGRFDSGGARTVFAELTSSGSTRIVRIGSDGSKTSLGPGQMPSTDADASLVAFVRGSSLVLASGDGVEVASVEVADDIIDTDFRSDGSAVAVAIPGQILVFDVTHTSIGESTSVQVSGDVTAVAWRDAQTLSVGTGGPASGLIVLDASGRSASVLDLPAEVADVDWSPDGSAALVTSTTGELWWTVGGAWGPVDAPFANAAIW